MVIILHLLGDDVVAVEIAVDVFVVAEEEKAGTNIFNPTVAAIFVHPIIVAGLVTSLHFVAFDWQMKARDEFGNQTTDENINSKIINKINKTPVYVGEISNQVQRGPTTTNNHSKRIWQMRHPEAMLHHLVLQTNLISSPGRHK